MGVDLTFVYAYYRNPAMFRRQLEEWGAYPDSLKSRIEFIVTDDCSPKGRIDECIGDIPKGINTRIFRLLKKVPWNWLACRNIGAKYACGKWILMTDMDHMIGRDYIQYLMDGILPNINGNNVYLFTRVSAPEMTEYKPHDDSFLMTKEMFWRIGGYDEYLSGNYGTAGRFRLRAMTTCKHMKRLELPLIRFDRDLIPDASTTDFPRKLPNQEHQKAIRAIELKKELRGRKNKIKTLSFPFQEISI